MLHGRGPAAAGIGLQQGLRPLARGLLKRLEGHAQRDPMKMDGRLDVHLPQATSARG
jgi:hypothetical protein